MNLDMIFLVVITSFIVGFVLDMISSIILDKLFAEKKWQNTEQDKDQAKNLTDLDDTRSDYDNQNKKNKEMIKCGEEDEGTDTLSEEEFEEINQAITVVRASNIMSCRQPYRSWNAAALGLPQKVEHCQQETSGSTNAYASNFGKCKTRRNTWHESGQQKYNNECEGAQIYKESSREYSKSSDKPDWRSNQPSWRPTSFSSHDRPKQMRSISTGDGFNTRNNFDNSSEKPWRPFTLKEINDDGRDHAPRSEDGKNYETSQYFTNHEEKTNYSSSWKSASQENLMNVDDNDAFIYSGEKTEEKCDSATNQNKSDLPRITVKISQLSLTDSDHSDETITPQTPEQVLTNPTDDPPLLINLDEPQPAPEQGKNKISEDIFCLDWEQYHYSILENELRASKQNPPQ
ncbi:340_t:CDS:10, partial [Racocetra persica]